jgi:hypothetical protein
MQGHAKLLEGNLDRPGLWAFLVAMTVLDGQLNCSVVLFDSLPEVRASASIARPQARERAPDGA